MPCPKILGQKQTSAFAEQAPTALFTDIYSYVADLRVFNFGN